MATDTQLTNLVVNTLTRKQYHDADLTDHGDELFVQSDHAGVYVGTNGIDALDTTNVSNCITEIPQDIKLELSSGTLTLKAGSKVYNGNGLILTTDSDKTLYQAYDNTSNMLLILKLSNTGLQTGVSGETVSSLPSPTTSYKVFYNTTDGKCYFDDGQMSECSFPLALVSRTTSGFSLINQIFNGFGYIGSTVFALPGIKWLAADGRNADGTLKNKENTNTTVLTTDYPYNGNIVLYITPNSLQTSGSYVQSETEPTSQYRVWYKPSENILRSRGAGDWIVDNRRIVFANAQTSTTGIESFSPIQPFQALDYNGTDLVVDFQRPTAANNYTWYRKYKSGWVEQGGQRSKPDSAAVGVALPVAMSDSNYSIQITDEFSSNMGTTPSVGNKITTGFNIYQGNGGSIICLWEVKGITA